jgi:hypothetical protein
MADYLAAAVKAIDGVLQERTPALLQKRNRQPFAEFLHADTGVMLNPPTCWVTPLHNSISDEGQGLQQVGTVMVIMGIAGTDPENLVNTAMDYVGAVTDAIESADGSWGNNIRHVHPGEQDYSARFRRGEGFVIFPTVLLTVEATEPPVTPADNAVTVAAFEAMHPPY